MEQKFATGEWGPCFDVDIEGGEKEKRKPLILHSLTRQLNANRAKRREEEKREGGGEERGEKRISSLGSFKLENFRKLFPFTINSRA